MFNDTSLICQFNLRSRDGLTNDLIECSEALFAEFNYKIRKIYTSTCEKVLSPSYKKFKSFINPDYFYSIRFQSDYNSKDFEPQTHLYTNIDNFGVKGTEYTLPEPLVKFSVVINDAELLKNPGNIYKDILSVLSKIPQIEMAGYSFLLPNSYGAISFSLGILRKMDMPPSLKNLARWYSDSNCQKSVIGLFNCFTGMTKNQAAILIDLFGKQNVEAINGITFFKNEAMNSSDIESYYTSAEYNKLCDEAGSEFCFLTS